MEKLEEIEEKQEKFREQMEKISDCCPKHFDERLPIMIEELF